MRDPLNREQLQVIAPSVFATQRHESRSDRYTFIPTIEIVEKLAAHGWLPTKAAEQRVRKEGRRGYQKHMLRFRKYDGTQPVLRVGDSLTEMVLVNSHDGSSAYQLQAGLFRLVCLNGLVIPESVFGAIKVKHSGHETDDILEASYRIIDEVPRIGQSVDEMRQVEVSQEEQFVFARAAAALRFEDKDAPKPESVLMARRADDKAPDLWHTFNRVQENLIKGGIRQPTLVTERGVRRRKVRSVNGIDEDIRLNKALWTLAEGFKALKSRAA